MKEGKEMTTTQDQQPVDEQELPEDFTSAWASVLLDVFEKQQRKLPDAEKSDEATELGDEAA